MLFFGKKEKPSNLKVADIHCHILPGVDDGSPDLESSLEMVKIAYEEGTRRLILTPHYIGGRNSYETEELDTIFAGFKKEVNSRYSDLELYLGNEIYYSDNTVQDLRAGKIHTMAGSKYVLVEFSPKDSFSRISEACRSITNAGYRMIVAHVERYQCMEKNTDHFIRLEEMGVYFQTNASALVKGEGHSPSHVTHWNKKVLVDNWISFLGSDAHDTNYRAPRVSEACNWIMKKNPDSAKGIIWENSEAIINNKPL